tara:strand:+ start:1160 stop:1531 length:372 start_codon:yes stop_codon:yes gene_type:complete
MPKARELTEVEKFYIENNPQQSDEEIASQIKGVGAKTVEKFRASITPAQDDKRDSITETREERIDRLGNGAKAGDFIAKQSGASIMTQQASEVTDARAIVHGTRMNKAEYESKNKDKIHKPQN